MRARPILFSAPMVRALLSGDKTQTRRVVKHIPALGFAEDWCQDVIARPPSVTEIVDYRRYCHYGAPGERLWVRETFARNDDETRHTHNTRIAYRANGEKRARSNGTDLPWVSPLFMPRWASRIMLEIIAVRVERLQDISEDDARAEGMTLRGVWWGPGPDWDGDGDGETAIDAYQYSWDTINGKRAPWTSDPWVWVLTFARVKP